jgi:predicted metallopeptidase
MIRYRRAPDLEKRVRDIIARASFTHIIPERVRCVRSYGSKAGVQQQFQSSVNFIDLDYLDNLDV